MEVVEHANKVYMGQPQWTDEHETEARSRCIVTFLDDLLKYTREQPAVVLFDTVDKTGEEVQRWIFLELIHKRLLPTRKDGRLLIVLAGEGVAEMLDNRLKPSDQECRQCIEPAASLSSWDEHHVADFLAVHEFSGLKAKRDRDYSRPA